MGQSLIRYMQRQWLANDEVSIAIENGANSHCISCSVVMISVKLYSVMQSFKNESFPSRGGYGISR